MKSNAKLSLLALSLALGTSLAYASDDIPIVPASVMKKDVPAYVSSGQVTNEVMGSVNENPVLTMKPGVNQIIPIAIGHPNRVVTPFGNPEIVSTSLTGGAAPSRSPRFRVSRCQGAEQKRRPKPPCMTERHCFSSPRLLP